MNTIHPNTQPIPNHMVWAVVSTIAATLCCCPFGLLGIVGIVQANKVNTLLLQGDEAAARQASEQAKIWCIVTTVLAVIGALASIGMVMTGGLQTYLEAMQAAGQLG